MRKDKTLWRFSVIPGIEEAAFNKVLERFYDLGVVGLVRENIQNSLDGKIPNIDKPVIVNIETGVIDKNDIPGFNEIKNRILCLKGRNNYTKETIEHMKNAMEQDKVSYITFEDCNTKGLTGAKNGQSDSEKDTWGIYAYNKGVHFEEQDNSIEQSRGGSHGVGKIASNAASDLYMMFFANCDDEGNKHIGGTVQLIEHKFNEEYYRSTGYFTNIKELDNKNTKFYPFENNYSGIFEKNTRGLKIIIPFLRKQFNDEKKIIKSVCDSFFISILEGKLEVSINKKMINKYTIKDYILNENYYDQNIENIKDEFTLLYFKTYCEMEPKSIVIKDYNKDHKFKLYFNYDRNILKGRTAIIRTIGMKIEDKKIKGNINKPFNAVLIPESIEEDSFLKSLENESHTELTYEHIKDQYIQKNAKRFINNISKEIAKIIENEITKNNPADGLMNTKDILYIVESEFKQDLSKIISKVKLNKSGKDQTLIMINDNVNKDKYNKENSGKKKKKRQAKKIKIKNEESYENNERQKNSRFSTNSDIVERLILRDHEYVKFDFSGTEEIKKAKLCDIDIVVLDGMGIESKEKFIIEDNYEYIVDTLTKEKCHIEDNKIKNVRIKQGITQIDIKLKSKYNKALKFVYYVEV